VAREHLDAINFEPVGDWQVLHEIDRAHPYAVRCRRYSIADGHEALIVFGRAAQTPFGLAGASDKRRIGAAVREVLGV
jgi:hypothetical protein